jgi:hypothetical protein
MQRVFAYFVVTLALVIVGLFVTGQMGLTVFKPGDVIQSEEVNKNFQVLQEAIEENQLPRDCTIEQIIKWDGAAWVCGDEVSSPLAPWLESIPIESAFLEGGASYTVGSGGNLSGLYLPDDFARFQIGFTLPFGYTPGEDVRLELTWAKQPSLTEPCYFQLRSNGVSAYRPGQPPMYSGDTFAEDLPGRSLDGSSAIVPAPATNDVQGLTVILSGQINSKPRYQPGDQLSYSLFRDGGNLNDTCNGTDATFVVFGMSAR